MLIGYDRSDGQAVPTGESPAIGHTSASTAASSVCWRLEGVQQHTATIEQVASHMYDCWFQQH